MPSVRGFCGRSLRWRARLPDSSAGLVCFRRPGGEGFPPHRESVSTFLLCYLAWSSLLISVLRRIRLKPLLAFDGPIDLFRRDHPLFRKTVRDHGRHRAVEEVKDSVMNH